MHRTNLKGVNFGSSASKTRKLCVIGSPECIYSAGGSVAAADKMGVSPWLYWAFHSGSYSCLKQSGGDGLLSACLTSVSCFFVLSWENWPYVCYLLQWQQPAILWSLPLKLPWLCTGKTQWCIFFFFFLEFWFSLGMLVVGGNLHNLKVSLALFVAKEKQKKSLLLADI